VSHRNRWTEPTDRDSRKEYRALRRELKLSRTTKARCAEIEQRLDEIAAGEPPRPSTVPGRARWSSDIKAWEWTNDGGRNLLVFAGDGKVRGWASEQEPSSQIPPTSGLRARTERELDRSERRAAGKSILSALPPASLSALAAADRIRTVERARNASSAAKAAALLDELSDHPLNKLAHELEQFLWNEDRSFPRPDFELQVKQRVRHWLSDAKYNHHDIRGNRTSVDEAATDALKLVAEKDAAEPGWYFRRVEMAYDSPPVQAANPVETPFSSTADVEPQAMLLRPRPLPASDLDTRASLLLSLDPYLSKLGTYSDEMKSRILFAIAEELRRVGHADGLFLKGLYESLRPKALSQFPPRS
jgi:hypothetical protein